MDTLKVCLLFSLLFTLQVISVTCTQFQVGDKTGWGVPKSTDDYNQWAMKNRFNVDDTLNFTYKKDSVMVVREEEYDKCHSPHPIFFGNNGATEIKLDRPGMFYFMSGVKGHCERGQKMVVKVLEPPQPPQSAADSSPKKDKNGAASLGAALSSLIFMLFIASIFLAAPLF